MDREDLRAKLKKIGETDSTDEHDEIRLTLTLDAMITAAESLMIEGGDGSLEEEAWLRSRFLAKWADKIAMTDNMALLRKRILRACDAAQRDVPDSKPENVDPGASWSAVAPGEG